MARTQHLPLYQSVFVYTRELYRLRAGLPKSVKHDLGREICQSSVTLLKLIVMANGAIKKERYLSRLVLEIEVQWALLRLLYELKAISSGQFKLLSERLSDITKQSQAWLKWVQKNESSHQKPLAQDLNLWSSGEDANKTDGASERRIYRRENQSKPDDKLGFDQMRREF